MTFTAVQWGIGDVCATCVGISVLVYSLTKVRIVLDMWIDAVQGNYLSVLLCFIKESAFGNGLCCNVAHYLPGVILSVQNLHIMYRSSKLHKLQKTTIQVRDFIGSIVWDQDNGPMTYFHASFSKMYNMIISLGVCDARLYENILVYYSMLKMYSMI